MNVQKTPLTSSLNSFAAGKAAEAIALTGKALPASVVKVTGQIVTVKFEVQDLTFTTLPNVTVPIIGSEYVRIPIQAGTSQKPGTLGVVIAIDAYIGGISGLGGGVADLSQKGNLATLVFVPIGNKNWTAVQPNVLTMYGVDGATLQDTVSHASSVAVTPASINASAAQGKSTISMTGSAITLSCGGHTLVINGSGISINGDVVVTGGLNASADITAGAGGAASVELQRHVHLSSGGTGNGGPPVPGS